MWHMATLANGNQIDLVLYLQAYAEGWSDKGFEEKYDERDCMEADRHYQRNGDSKWGRLLGGFFARDLKCLSIQGQSSTLAKAIITNFSEPYVLHPIFPYIAYATSSTTIFKLLYNGR